MVAINEEEFDKKPLEEESSSEKLKKGFKFKSILHKMIASFSAVILFTVIIIVVSVFASTRASTGTNLVIQDQLPAMMKTQELIDNFKDRSQVALEYLADGNEQRAREFEELTITGQALEQEVLAVSSNKQMTEAVALSQQWTSDIETTVIAEMLVGNGLIANSNMKKLKPLREMVLRIYNENILAVQDEVETSGQSVIQSQNMSLIIILILGAIAVAFSVFISLYTARSITTPIREMNTRLDAISNEDFTMQPL